MNVKNNKVGITFTAVAIAAGVLSGSLYFTAQHKNQDKDASAAVLYSSAARDGIAISSNQLQKLGYNYTTSQSTTSQTEVSNFNMIYILDNSESRNPVLHSSIDAMKTFVNTIDLQKNGFAMKAYWPAGSEVDSSLNNINLDSVTISTNGGYIFEYGVTENNRLAKLTEVLEKLHNQDSSRQNVLIFESDFEDFNPVSSGAAQDSATGNGFLNSGTMAKLKETNTKIVMIGDNFSEKTLTEYNNGLSYSISSKRSDNSFLDRGDIMRMFVTEVTKDFYHSTNTKYELSLRGTSYKFSPNFLAEMRQNSNFVVESEDFIRLKVPEWNAQNAAGNRAQDYSVSFSGVDIVYRNSNSVPTTTEYLTVSKDTTVERIAIPAPVDKSSLRTLVSSVSQKRQAVQQDAEVVKKLKEANDVLNSDTATQDQVNSAKQALENALANAERSADEAEQRERENQEEQDRQAAARQALAAAQASKSPADIKDAEDKISAVRDAGIKRELQSQLDKIKKDLEDARNALRDAINKAKEVSTAGKTEESKNTLQAAIRDAENKLNDNNASQQDLENAKRAVETAVNNLKTDKAPIIATLQDFEKEPDYIKDDEEIKHLVEALRNLNDQDNPSVQDVRSAISALKDKIQEKKDAELARQKELQKEIENAFKEIEDNKSKKDELPVVDMDKLKELLGGIQDLTMRDKFKDQLDEIQKAIDAKREKIEADKRAEAERKLQEELERQRREEERLRREREEAAKLAQTKAPNTGFESMKDSGAIVTLLSSGALMLGFVTMFIFKKK